MFKKTFLLAAAATLAFGFSAYAAEDYFSMPEDSYGCADVVDQPSLASGQTDPLPRSQELEFAMPEDSIGRADVVDQPSLASGHVDPLSRAQELKNAFPVYD